jgi:ATP-dependent DNA ligase
MFIHVLVLHGNFKKEFALRTCKHIRGIQGAQFEFQRTNNKKTAAAAAAAASTKKGTNDGENESLLPFSSVMLAKKYEEENHGSKLSTGVWWMSEKLDGLRAVSYRIFFLIFWNVFLHIIF